MIKQKLNEKSYGPLIARGVIAMMFLPNIKQNSLKLFKCDCKKQLVRPTTKKKKNNRTDH